MQKKKIAWLSLALLLMLTLTMLVSCGDKPKVVGVNGLKESYYQGQELDFSGIVFTYTDEQGQPHDVQWGDAGLDISFSVAEVNAEAEMKFTYGNLVHVEKVPVLAVENVAEISYQSGIDAGFVGEEQDFSSLLIKVKMENGDEFLMKYNENVTVEVEKNEQENTALATITVAGVSCQREYSLIRYYVTSVLDPQFWSDYELNISEKDNKRQEYKDRTRAYLVGSMNGFIFSPKLKVSDYAQLDEDGEPVKATLPCWRVKSWQNMLQSTKITPASNSPPQLKASHLDSLLSPSW